ncbi:hypothetical protein GS455_26900 [Rhodococcus hoagii]|nr:hypothetical protein [Prescottella equi]
MSNLAIDQIERARTYVVERNIDIAAARPAFISQYPQLARAPRESTTSRSSATIGIWLNVRAPWTTDSVAEQLANQSGAFPWNGPVRNGFTVAEYQNRFREMAREHLFTWRQLGLITEGG